MGLISLAFTSLNQYLIPNVTVNSNKVIQSKKLVSLIRKITDNGEFLNWVKHNPDAAEKIYTEILEKASHEKIKLKQIKKSKLAQSFKCFAFKLDNTTKSIPLHLLKAKSTVFDLMTTDALQQTPTDSEIIPDFLAHIKNSYTVFLDYLNTGKVEVNKHNDIELLECAYYYECAELFHICRESIRKRLNDKLVLFLMGANHYINNEIKTLIFGYLCENKVFRQDILSKRKPYTFIDIIGGITFKSLRELSFSGIDQLFSNEQTKISTIELAKLADECDSDNFKIVNDRNGFRLEISNQIDVCFLEKIKYFMTIYGINVTELTISNTKLSQKEIDTFADFFPNIKSLSISNEFIKYLPKNWEENVINLNCSECENLEKISFKNVIDVNCGNCVNLKEIYAPKAFKIDCHDCIKLSNLQLPLAEIIYCWNSIKLKTLLANNVKILFCWGCVELESFDFPKAHCIDCSNCKKLKTLTGDQRSLYLKWLKKSKKN